MTGSISVFFYIVISNNASKILPKENIITELTTVLNFNSSLLSLDIKYNGIYTKLKIKIEESIKIVAQGQCINLNINPIISIVPNAIPIE
jgi:hypothetical protein